MQELFIEVFRGFVPDISKNGLHSLRAGGAIVFANSGISDGLFKKHVKWKSESVKDGYIKDDSIFYSKWWYKEIYFLSVEYSVLDGKYFLSCKL